MLESCLVVLENYTREPNHERQSIRMVPQTGFTSWWVLSQKTQPTQRAGEGGIYYLEQVRQWEYCLVTKQGLTLCDLMDWSPPGSSVHGISQARTLEWVAISFSRESSWPRDWIQVSDTAGRFFTIWATREAHRDGCSVLWPLHIQWLSHPPSSSPQIPQSPWAPSSLKITWPPHLLFEHVLLPAPWNASFSGSFAVWDHVSSLANGPKTVYMNKWISCFLFVPQWLRQVRTM